MGLSLAQEREWRKPERSRVAGTMRLTRGKLQTPTLPRCGVDSNEWATKLWEREAEANAATMWVFPSQCDFHVEEWLFSAAQCGPPIQRLLTSPSFVAHQPFTPHFTIPHFLNPSHPALLCELSYAHSHSPLCVRLSIAMNKCFESLRWIISCQVSLVKPYSFELQFGFWTNTLRLEQFMFI